LRAKAGPFEIEREHLVCDFGTEHLPKSFEHRVGARQIEDGAAVGGESKRYMMIRQRDALKRFRDSALLGAQRLQELEPCGSVEKQLADFDSSPLRHGARAGIFDVT